MLRIATTVIDPKHYWPLRSISFGRIHLSSHIRRSRRARQVASIPPLKVRLTTLVVIKVWKKIILLSASTLKIL